MLFVLLFSAFVCENYLFREEQILFVDLRNVSGREAAFGIREIKLGKAEIAIME